MNENEPKKDMVDVTDCLEAISAFKSIKNLIFLIMLICLILLQGLFWLEYTGRVNKEGMPCPLVWNLDDQSEPPATGIFMDDQDQGDDMDADDDEAADDSGAESVTSTENASAADTAAPDTGAIKSEIEKKAEIATEKAIGSVKIQETDTDAVTTDQDSSGGSWLRWQHVFYLIKVSNFVLIISLALYTVLLMFCILISMVGRLGGVAHISRAFIHSVFAMVFLLPWQNFFPGVIAGAIYTPNELLCWQSTSVGPSVMGTILYLVRFVVLWLIVLVFILSSQSKTCRWSKATLRRLGMHH